MFKGEQFESSFLFIILIIIMQGLKLLLAFKINFQQECAFFELFRFKITKTVLISTYLHNMGHSLI